MTSAGYNKRQKALSVMCALYGGKFTPEQMQLYDKFLSDIPGELVEGAVSLLCKTSVYPPTVAEIRETAQTLWNSAQGKQIPNAGRAWQEVLDAISRVGSYGTPHFDDAYTEETVRRFGWRELCMQPTDTIAVARAQFTKIYNALVEEKKETRQIAAALQNGAIGNLIQGLADKKAMALPAPEGENRALPERQAPPQLPLPEAPIIEEILPMPEEFPEEKNQTAHEETGFPKAGETE